MRCYANIAWLGSQSWVRRLVYDYRMEPDLRYKIKEDTGLLQTEYVLKLSFFSLMLSWILCAELRARVSFSYYKLKRRWQHGGNVSRGKVRCIMVNDIWSALINLGRQY